MSSKLNFYSSLVIAVVYTLHAVSCCTVKRSTCYHHSRIPFTFGAALLRWFNTLRLRQNGRHFADENFKRIFLKENVEITIKISLKFVPKSPIVNIPALFQIMAWRLPGDKPLSETMMVRLPRHICVTLPQWVNSLTPGRLEWNLI